MLVTCRPTVCTDGDDQAAGIQSDFDDDDDRDDCLWSDTEFDVDEPEPDPPVRHSSIARSELSKRAPCLRVSCHLPSDVYLPFLQILPTLASLLSFRTDYMDSPDCLLILLSISVFLLFSFSAFHF